MVGEILNIFKIAGEFLKFGIILKWWEKFYNFK